MYKLFLVPLILVGLVTLVGCAGNLPRMQQQVEFAADNMQGFPVENLRDCAGLPHSREESKNYEVYVYRTTCSSVLGMCGQCEMQFYIADDLVAQVSYSGSNPGGLAKGSEFCAPIISECLVKYFGQSDPGSESMVKFNKIENL
jgi:hypothetical protein